MCNQSDRLLVKNDLFSDLAKEFRKHHSNSLNVALHLMTTPVGWGATLKLLSMTGVSVEFVIIVYVLVISATSPLHISILTILLHAAMYFSMLVIDTSFTFTIGVVVVSYCLQDVSHLITGEATFQSTYSQFKIFILHSFFLIPLCFDALLHLQRSPLYWIVPRDSSIKTKVTCDRYLQIMRKWVLDNNPNKETTTHWWYSDLKGDEKDAFDGIAKDSSIKKAFREVWDLKSYDVEIVHDMNEIYVASPTAMKTSDTVFLMDHIDGPWILYPFCTVYRVLVAVNENKDVTTHLKHIRTTTALSSGDCLGFDFNREIHRVSFASESQNKEPRITLKLHYVVYPKCLKPFGLGLAFITSRYDEFARRLFLFTIKPKTIIQKMSARIGILLTTYLVENFETYIGVYNIVRVAVMYWLLAGRISYGCFLFSTSFVHYATYISAYYYRSDVNYGRLLRDCAFWKFISIGQLLFWYSKLSNFGSMESNISLTAVGIGSALAASATYAIGVERTYFGSELGIVDRKWISVFPYNCIPHPMIVGALIALCGFYVETNFRNAFPYLVPIHCLLYVIHAIQEHFDIHDVSWRVLQRTDRAF